MAKARRYLRFGRRLVTDTKYRNRVLSLIDRHADPHPPSSGSPADAADLSWLVGTRVYLIGGCEFTYVREALDDAGAITFDTFAHGRPSDPLVEVGDGASPLWAFEPDAIALSQAELAGALFHRTQWEGTSITREDQDAHLDAVVGSLGAALDRIRESFADVPVFVLGLPMVHRPSLGVHAPAILGAVRALPELLIAYRQALYDLARRVPATAVIDPQIALEVIGVEAGTTAETELLGGHFTRAGGAEITRFLTTSLHASHPRSPKVKVVVTDLDDTLWSGVLREDGPDGVSVRRHVVRALRYLAARGIVLAICSKNDPEESEHLEGLLGPEFMDLVVDVHLGWGPKSAAIEDLAARLDLSLDTFAFFDDNPREREEVAVALPQVRVFSDREILGALQRPEMQAGPHLTAEAASRSTSYRAQAQRNKARSEVTTPEEFLRSLEMVVEVRAAASSDLPRVAELLQRTNQLNATGRRLDLGSLRDVHESASGAVTVQFASDRFGDYGLIGASVCSDEDHGRHIAELAFSCRAMGRGVEAAMFAHLAVEARSDGWSHLVMDVARTSRNAEMIRLIGEAGFVPDGDRFTLALDGELPTRPDWLSDPAATA